MKVFILGDLEGTAGVVDFKSQTYSDAKYYEQTKRLAILEINALIDGVIAGGATEVWFLDGHGPGGIDYALMHAEAQMMIGRPISAPWGLDPTFDAMLLYGHHSMSNTNCGVLCHSWSSRTIDNCWLNGKLIGEIGFNISLAGEVEVPTIFVSGDNTTIAEAKEYVPDIASVETKVGLSQTSALSISPLKSQQLHREVGEMAMRLIGQIKPYDTQPPYTFKTQLLEATGLKAKAHQSHVEIVNDRTYQVRGQTLVEVARKR